MVLGEVWVDCQMIWCLNFSCDVAISTGFGQVEQAASDNQELKAGTFP
jgi:hypothetical protein